VKVFKYTYQYSH